MALVSALLGMSESEWIFGDDSEAMWREFNAVEINEVRTAKQVEELRQRFGPDEFERLLHYAASLELLVISMETGDKA